jgi:nucleoside-diphosphate-sugar epimerase
VNVLVTGATGFLGRHLTRALLDRGVSVRILARNPVAAEELVRSGAELCPGDLRDADEISHACAGMEAVVHAGAFSAPWGPEADFHAVNVGGTENVLAGCRRHGVRRVVHISSPSVVFDGRDQINAPETVPYPRRFASVYSLTKKLAEDRVSSASESLQTVILRPKAIFGPGDTSLVPAVLNAARAGRLPQIGSGQNRVDLTYVGNVVHGIQLALQAPGAAGGTYTLTNGEPILVWEVIRRVLESAGCEARLRRLPYPAAWSAAALMEARARLTGQYPLLTRYSVAILARTQTYDLTAARRDLGYEPIVPLEEGIQRTLAALKNDAG